MRTTCAWEQRKLGEVCTFDKGRGYSKADICESGTPLVLYGRLYTQYETVIESVDTYAESKDGSLYSRGGEVIVPSSGETAEDIAVASHISSSGILIGGDLNVITPQPALDSTFMAIGITNGSPHEQLAMKAQGKSVVHIHNDDIAGVVFSYPSLPEQRAVGALFSRLDSLIALHQGYPIRLNDQSLAGGASTSPSTAAHRREARSLGGDPAPSLAATLPASRAGVPVTHVSATAAARARSVRE